MRLALVSAALALASAPGALAWGAAGHEIVATIAQMHLHPDVLPVLCDILDPAPASSSASSTSDPAAHPPCHLAPIAAWADRVRMTPAYRHTASWHYVGALDDLPGAACAFPGARGWAGRRDANVLAALGNQTRIVAGFLDGEGEGGLADAADALRFLVHFAGDMHMPLHLTGRERGGNGAKVTFDGRMTNLHSVWDSFLIAQALRTIPANYSRPLLGGLEAHLRGTIYDGYVRRLMIDGFGLSVGGGRGAGEGRFGAIEEWLKCPSADDADGDLEATTEHAWPIVQTALRSERWDDDVLCPYAWARAIHELNCDFPVWPTELDKLGAGPADDSPSFEHEHDCAMDGRQSDVTMAGRRPSPHPELLELDTPEYAGRVREDWVVERLLAMAGIRLAGILNGLVLGESDVRVH
ncbi:phospholipase C/P1 nuclease [Daedalea quercina L-15889]|uniref:Phospholipase C/P1 nuclease n=1 Tax=Daedalea quercina L-15889 TaxID=1314783 RepID=A0A165R852_9APHY|nr:phospholipase C/P1 nuclease [Daedalea quercina L-15889]